MPYLTATDALPERPVVIVFYGDPGMRKTSMIHTAEKPLLLDFDNGVARSYGRKDVIVVDSWQEVLDFEAQGFYKKFKTIGIDTAKAALDDFLLSYVAIKDYKNKVNKLAAYGAIGDEFKLFQSNRRQEGSDLIIVAHSKKDEDSKKNIPDVTGQSSSLIMRIADQVGYVTTKNGVPTIIWNITDSTIGKNTANLPDMPIPDKNDPAWKTFMADIIQKVKTALVEMSEAQRELLLKSERFQDEISTVEDVDDLNMIVAAIQSLPKVLKEPLYLLIQQRAEVMKWIFDRPSRAFILDPAAVVADDTEPTAGDPDPGAPVADPDQVDPGAPAVGEGADAAQIAEDPELSNLPKFDIGNVVVTDEQKAEAAKKLDAAKGQAAKLPPFRGKADLEAEQTKGREKRTGAPGQVKMMDFPETQNQ